MHPIETLEAEHRKISVLLVALQAWASGVVQREADDRRELRKFVLLLRGFVDDCHHFKEEDLLFRAVLASDSSTRAEVGTLLREHTHSRELARSLEDLACRTQPWTSENRRAIAQICDDYAVQARAHMVREERGLFARARSLPDAHRRTLARGFAAFEAREPACCQGEEFEVIIAELIASHGPIGERVASPP